MSRRDSRRRCTGLTTKNRQVLPLAGGPSNARLCAPMRKCLPPALAALVLVFAGFASAAQPEWHSDERCRLASDPLPAAYARCGKLTVPLDPAAPDGATIEIFVARVAALSAEPRLDPLLLIAG